MCKMEGCDAPTEGKKRVCDECRVKNKKAAIKKYQKQYVKPVMQDHPCSIGVKSKSEGLENHAELGVDCYFENIIIKK